jgi:hypothetical protein
MASTEGREPLAAAAGAKIKTFDRNFPASCLNGLQAKGGANLPAQIPAQIPAQMMTMPQRMRSETGKHCDYVGASFADEARRIHRGEIDPRAIYGKTSPEQAEAPMDEGIEIASIPSVPRADRLGLSLLISRRRENERKSLAC